MKWFCWTGLIFLFLNAAAAHQMVPMDLDTLTRQSDWIVHGRVEAMECRKDPERGIHTLITLIPEDILKGDLKPGEPVILVQAGGVLGDQQVRVPLQAEFQLGEEIVAFLVCNPRGEGVTIGLAQGKFEVFQVEGGAQKLVCNPFYGRIKEGLTARITSSSTPSGSILETSSPLPLSLLKAKVGKANQ